MYLLRSKVLLTHIMIAIYMAAKLFPLYG